MEDNKKWEKKMIETQIKFLRKQINQLKVRDDKEKIMELSQEVDKIIYRYLRNFY